MKPLLLVGLLAMSTVTVTCNQLPPEGVYFSCEIDTNTVPASNTPSPTNLGSCEGNDQVMVNNGITWENNYLLPAANATSTNSLVQWFTFDAGIGMSQDLEVSDGSEAGLSGNTLITGFNNSLATTCPGHFGLPSSPNPLTTNQQIIQCIALAAQSVPGFNWAWKIADEPGCPNQSIGYCAGTWAGGNYANANAVATYIHSIDPTHQIFVVNVGDCCNATLAGQQTITSNLQSWLATPPASTLGWDYYPIPEGTATPGSSQYISADAVDTALIADTIAAYNPGMTQTATLQAFSWAQEGGNDGCSSMTVCPSPTFNQLLAQRNYVLWYAQVYNQTIAPAIYWYEWAAVWCHYGSDSPCTATTNLSNLKAAIAAPFPSTAPTPIAPYPGPTYLPPTPTPPP